MRQLRTAFSGMLQRLEDRRAEYSPRGQDYEWARHRATVASQALRMYLTHDESMGEGLVLRSEAMAANTSWAVDQLGPGARVVMLATGVNVARSPWTYSGAETQLPSVGALLAERYDYFALTMAFGSGEFSPPNPITGSTVIPDTAADSVDLALAAVGAPYLLVDLRGRTAPAPPAGWLSAPHPLRPMQNVAAPPAYRFPEAVDALVYVDRIHGHEARRP